MVSIDFYQVGRVDFQVFIIQDLDFIKKFEEIKQCNDAFIFVFQEDIVGSFKFILENYFEIFKKKFDFEFLKSEMK